MIDHKMGVQLRKLGKQDIEPTFRWRNTPDIYKWCRQYEPLSDIKHTQWFEHQALDPSIEMYAITKPSKPLIGVCGLTSIDTINRHAEFSLYIGPEHAGEGAGEAALRTLVAHGFHGLNLNMIWGEVFDDNPALHMFERVGFQRDGFRRDMFYRGGKYIGTHMISLVRGEWIHSRFS